MPESTRMSRAARQAQLIGAAASAFLAGGYERTSMEDVAKSAGVSRLIVYRNFASKEELYRAVLREVLVDLGAAFSGLSFEDVADRGAATVVLPVARAHPDAFRLLWRDAWHQPPFGDLADEFRTYVTVYARAILRGYIADETRLDWAARSAGSNLVDSVCHWLDDGDPSRDDEVATAISDGLRALAGAWSDDSAG